MLKSLVIVAALAVAEPGLAFAQQPNKSAQPDPPSGPALLNVEPRGLSNNPNGVPLNPAVFNALRGVPNSGQPTGGSPPNGLPNNGVVTFSPASQ